MTQEILRIQNLGIGLEVTPGTSVAAAVSIPTETFDLKHMVDKKMDTSGFGVIDENVDSHIAKEQSELSATFIARSQSLGYILKMALGTASGTPSTVETGVYLHSFTRANTNSHPTATVYRDGANADEKAVFHILDTLEFDAAVGEYVKCKLTTKGDKIQSGSFTASYLTGTADEPFKAVSAVIKIAADISSLSGATAINLQDFKFTIKKNPKQTFALGSTQMVANNNQQFAVAGDFTAMYTDNSLRDLFTANTKQAIQIVITGATLIGATKYNQITIQIAQVDLSTWDRSTGLNELITQQVGFTGEYNFTNTQTMNITLQNVKSSGY